MGVKSLSKRIQLSTAKFIPKENLKWEVVKEGKENVRKY